ncbi:hypothetical protein SNE40_011988 [Patella caerulea]|uniref:K Homology domain-containing protein n=1 Tax=Patella caerulea TaxID=87958 RepID=A0AAN8PKI7_PATCE
MSYGQERDYGRGGGGGRGYGGDGGGDKSTFYVDQQHVGRIIGKGGNRIRDLQDESGCQIKIESRNSDREGQARVDLIGDSGSQSYARNEIQKICDQPPREGGGYRGGGRGGGRDGGYGGGRDGGYGGGRDGGYGGGRDGGGYRGNREERGYGGDGGGRYNNGGGWGS